MADTQNILPRHTLRVSSLFWTWIANRSNDIGSACHFQPRARPLHAEGHFSCRLAGVSQRAVAVHFLLLAPLPSLCCFFYLAASLARAVLHVWSSDVAWKPTFKRGLVKSNWFLLVDSFLWGAAKKWARKQKQPPLKIYSTPFIFFLFSACQVSLPQWTGYN